MSNPHRNKHHAQLMREARIGLVLVMFFLGLFVYVAMQKIKGGGAELVERARDVPIAKMVWPNEIGHSQTAASDRAVFRPREIEKIDPGSVAALQNFGTSEKKTFVPPSKPLDKPVASKSSRDDAIAATSTRAKDSSEPKIQTAAPLNFESAVKPIAPFVRQEFADTPAMGNNSSVKPASFDEAEDSDFGGTLIKPDAKSGDAKPGNVERGGAESFQPLKLPAKPASLLPGMPPAAAPTDPGDGFKLTPVDTIKQTTLPETSASEAPLSPTNDFETSSFSPPKADKKTNSDFQPESGSAVRRSDGLGQTNHLDSELKPLRPSFADVSAASKEPAGQFAKQPSRRATEFLAEPVQPPNDPFSKTEFQELAPLRQDFAVPTTEQTKEQISVAPPKMTPSALAPLQLKEPEKKLRTFSKPKWQKVNAINTTVVVSDEPIHPAAVPFESTGTPESTNSFQPRVAADPIETSAANPIARPAAGRVATQVSSPWLNAADPDAKPSSPKTIKKTSHTVVVGDSYWSIAQAVYDDGRLFRALYMYNAGGKELVETEPRPGMTVALPPESELRARWPELCPRVEGELNPESKFGERIYVTRADENLFEIARDRLGQASRYLDIMELNQTRLPAKTSHLTPLAAGIRLTMPLK